MKILLTIGDITLKGGAQRVVVNLANTFCEYGYEVGILSFYKKNESPSYTLDSKIKVDFLNKTSIDKKRKNLFYKLTYKFFESYLVNKMNPRVDFMIFNNSPHFPLFKNKNTAYIKIIHEVSKKRYLKRNNYFDILILLNDKEINFFNQYHKNIQVIPNFLTHISEQNTDYSQKVILSIGRMTKIDEKGFLRLIDIWGLAQKDKSLDEWKLCIVGEGESRDKIEKKIQEKGLKDSIILKNFTNEIDKEYLQASIYAMTSYMESFGMVLVESASFGIPSIAFDVLTGPSDIIEDNKTGFLVQDGDIESYAQKLKVLMSDETLRETFGKNAKERMKNKFSKEIVMQQWSDLFSPKLQ